VGVEEVDRLVRLATTLGVEVEAALGEPPILRMRSMMFVVR